MKKVILSIVLILILCFLVLFVNYYIFQKTVTKISQGQSIIQNEIKNRAVLVIDVQESITGRLSTNDYYITNSEELIAKINQIADSSAQHDIPVIYSKSEIQTKQ